jgi:hypothetical protein
MLTPTKKVRRKTTEGMLKGKVEIVGDIVNTSDLYKDWDLYQDWLAAEERRTRPAAKRQRKAS